MSMAIARYTSLSRRYLAVHLKRTLLTILGVVLSVALMCAGGLFMESLKARALENVKLTYGSFHAFMEGISRDQAERLALNARVEEAGLALEMGLVGTAGSRKLVIFGADAAYRKAMGISVIQGRFPETEGEIAAEAWTLKTGGEPLGLGEAVTLAVMMPASAEAPQGSLTVRTFTVTGFLEPRRRSLAFGAGLAVVTLAEAEKARGPYFMYTAGFTLREGLPLQESIKAVADELGLGPSAVRQNAALLTAMGAGANNAMNASVMRIQVIIALIIIIATVAVISNTFTISVVERIRQLGVLRCVGATSAQIRGIVFREAVIVSVAGIPLGIGCGILALFAVTRLLTALSRTDLGFSGMRLVVSAPIVIGSTALGLVSVFLSVLGPALRAGRIPPLEAVVAPGRTVRERIRRRRHTAMKRLFGVVGVMAGRTIARNRKRFAVTVASIAIGIALFVIFSAFIGMARNAAANQDPGPFIRDLAIYSAALDRGGELTPADLEEVRSIPNVKRVFALREANGFLLAPDGAVTGEFRSYARGNPAVLSGAPAAEPGETPVPASILGVEAGELAELRPRIIEGNPDPALMERENGVFIVPKFSTEKQRVDAVSLAIGDSIRLVGTRTGPGEGTQPLTVTVMGFASSLSWSELLDGKSVGIVASGRTFERLTGKAAYSRLDIELDDKASSGDAAEFLSSIARARGARVVDYAESDLGWHDMMLQISILLYGLVAVIGLIGALNIVNTIGTNLILRVRELGMLRAVGMTKTQVKGMVLLEGILYGLYSAVPGSAVGILGAFLLFSNITNVQRIPWVTPWASIAAACLTATILGTLSALVPLRRIGRMSAVESIRAEE